MTADQIRAEIDRTFRTEAPRVLATLARILGDLDLAEEGTQEAFAAAVKQWPTEGVPANPRSWLVTTGRFRAIDALRKRARFDTSAAAQAQLLSIATDGEPSLTAIADDDLRLIFTCCHPLLPRDGQVALTLREVCGLTTEEIAKAFLSSPPTIAQRIVRAKAKIREEKIPYEVPDKQEMEERLASVLQVIYLVFNEGYAASSGPDLVRFDLADEAIRLGRLLADLLPQSEVLGLLALMLLQDSRRLARTSPKGDLVLLPDQDRALWNRSQIGEGIGLVERALKAPGAGSYSLQAAIAAVHSESESSEKTDWAQIVALYDVLLARSPSPVVELNRAIAVAMHEGPEAGLKLIDNLIARGDLGSYSFAHSARAEMLRRLGRRQDARQAYEAALGLVKQEAESAFLRRRLEEMSS